VEPILRGKQLIEIGFTPGPRLGEILRAVDDAHRDGEFDRDDVSAAIDWVRARYPIEPGSEPT